MDKMISLARIMFAGLGIYLAITICGGIIQSVIFIFNDPSLENIGNVSMMLILSIVMLAAVVLVLFIKGDYWANKLIAADVDADKPVAVDLTLAMAFRLVCVGAGLICVRSIIFKLTSLVSQIIMARQFADSIVSFGKVSMTEYIQTLLLISLTVYLLCGAPHFVRWQVDRTLKFCGEN